MKSYHQYCPIARAAEIFAERWTPIILRNLYLGAETFTQIREGAPGLPKAVLERRLTVLRHEGVIEARPATGGRGWTYHLSPMGRELVDVCFALGKWGTRWLEVGPEHLDARVVLWSMAHLIDREHLPPARTVVRFDVTDAVPKSRFWLVLERESVEVCVRDPGYEEHLWVTTTQESLAAWHMGRLSMTEARARGLIEVVGPRPLVRALGTWGLSPFAGIPPITRRAPPSSPRTHALSA